LTTQEIVVNYREQKVKVARPKGPFRDENQIRR